MTDDEIKKLEEIVNSPRKVYTDSGSVEERSITDVEKGLRLVDKKKAEVAPNGRKRSALSRLGLYGRNNM